MNVTKTDAFQVPRCPYLGLHDDPGTSLAYPSAWNYCYHATPPAPVLVSHQADTCLCPEFASCAVYQTGMKDPLPADLRGKPHFGLQWGKTGRLLLWAFAVAMLTLLIALPLPSLGTSAGSLALTKLAAILPLQGEASPQAVSGMVPGGGATTGAVTPAAGTQLDADPLPTGSGVRTKTPASSSSAAATPDGTCGHALDVPFGRDVKFLLHRVASGENLTLYAARYHTSIAAILAVNAHLPMPVWEDWIIVIPVDSSDVAEVPPFEPYQAIGASLSLGELAQQLDADARMLSRYNAFEGSCRFFSGWLLVPREP